MPGKVRKIAKPRAWQNLLEFFHLKSQAFQWALTAAVVVLAIGIAWFAYQNSALRNQLELARNEPRFRQLEQDLQAAQRREMEAQDRLGKQSGQSEELAEQLRQETERIEHLERELANARQRAPSILTAIVAPGLTRGGAVPTKIIVPSGTEVVQLHLPLPSDKADYKNYSATLSEGTGRQVFIHKNVKPEATRAGKALIARVSPRVLQGNDYVFLVKGENAEGLTESVETYPFSVIKK